MANQHLLVVSDLRTSFMVPAGEVRSVAGISFTVDKGKILGIVGESGSGKSVTASSIMQILVGSGRIKEGSSVLFEGEELVGMSEQELRKIRGDKIAMIFQDPMTALNPVFTIGHQMEEAILLHKKSRVDVLTEPEEKQLRDDKTALARLLSARKAISVKDPQFKAKAEESFEEEKCLNAKIAQDKVVFDIAVQKAKAQAAYEKTISHEKYRNETKKLILSLQNVFLGRFVERRQETLRFLNEKQDAIRLEAKHLKEKSALVIADSKRLHSREWAETLRPLKLEMAAIETSVPRKRALKEQVSQIDKKYAALLKADQAAYEKAMQEADDIYQQNLLAIKAEHKKRLKEIKKRRREAIREALSELKESREAYRSSFNSTRYNARKRAIEMLTLVGVNEPEKRMKQYPFEFSGGMLQRVMIAMALLCDPDLLIADEPTTALDVTIQAQILELIKDIQKKLGMGVIIITHDLGVVAQICDEVDVMYAGRIVERGTVDEIFYNPKHEYTKGLISSIPGQDAVKGRKLHPIEGNPVDVFALPKGCSFGPRCEKCLKICLERYPAERQLSPDHYSSCFFSVFEDVKAGKISKEDFVAYMNQGFVIAPSSGAMPKENRFKDFLTWAKVKLSFKRSQSDPNLSKDSISNGKEAK